MIALGADPGANKLVHAVKAAAEMQVGWMKWPFSKLLKELFFKYQPNLAAQFPTLQSCVKVKCMYLDMTLLGTLLLNALFFSTSGIPSDGSCSDLDPLFEQIAVIIYSALFVTGVLNALAIWLTKEPVYEHVTTDERTAQVNRWRRREDIAYAFGVLLCLV